MEMDERRKEMEKERKDEDAGIEAPRVEACNAQDLHSMIERMVKPIVELQESGGFAWNWHVAGKFHKVQFIPFVMFIKGDTVEHDKHCGSFTSRTEKIKNLCRYCTCPTKETDDPYRPHDERKSPSMMEGKSKEALKLISQQPIANCWYPLRFGLHNILHVHGACPLEVLHWMQLGKYKYIRIAFFDRCGPESKLSKIINEVAKSMGILFRRQSDRDLPRTDFSKGIRKGKLMAHEMTGVILVLLTVLRSTEGRNACLDKASKEAHPHVGTEDGIANWIQLLENCLTWEAWLSQESLPVIEVLRFRTKVRDLLYIEQDVGKRTAGMGYKTFNYHAARHVYSDIINFGVPKWINTMSNEMHHKQSKNAALTTQRRPQEFDFQVGTRCHESDCVNLAHVEITTGRAPMLYGNQPKAEESPPKERAVLSGVKVQISFDRESGELRKPNVLTRMKDKAKFRVESDVLEFLLSVVGEHDNDLASFSIFTEHRRQFVGDNEDFTEGSPLFLGKPWRDWCTICWSEGEGVEEDDESPAQIYWFVDLRENHTHGLIKDKIYKYTPGIYAIIESADLDPLTKSKDRRFADMSDLIVSYVKEFKKPMRESNTTERQTCRQGKFILNGCETVCMIADVEIHQGSIYENSTQEEICTCLKA
jgi:hypothetical protein